MFYKANEFEIAHILKTISDSFEIFGPKKSGKISKYDKIDNFSEIEWEYSRSIMSIKKLLYPNGKELERAQAKQAFVGLPLCDIASLNIFLKQFSGSGLVPKREDIFIVGSDCQPDDNCFCNLYDLSHLWDYDLFVLKRSDDFLIHAKGWRAKEIMEKCAIKKTEQSFDLKPKAKAENIDLKNVSKLINDKQLTNDFWQGISNNCFGCGACSTVCPLCFCFEQNFKSCPDGQDKKCLNWDSCFSANFSQIQFGNDMRPENKDRLYNWYHHKFVRGPKELDEYLCVGCGRCITACPAHLSIHNILSSLEKKYGPKD